MKQQYQIVKKKVLTPEISQISVHAPLVAAKAKAGQFIILRVDENGERIPLTISSADQENGTITVIFQKVGGTTLALDQLNEGDCLHDFVGPLGEWPSWAAAWAAPLRCRWPAPCTRRAIRWT